MWQIEFNATAEADLLRLDKAVRQRILKFLLERVKPHAAPQQLAEPLAGEFQGLYRFRVGDYRIVFHLRRNRLLILVLFVDHRSTVYKRRSLPSDFKREADEDTDAT